MYIHNIKLVYKCKLYICDHRYQLHLKLPMQPSGIYQEKIIYPIGTFELALLPIWFFLKHPQQGWVCSEWWKELPDLRFVLHRDKNIKLQLFKYTYTIWFNKTVSKSHWQTAPQYFQLHLCFPNIGKHHGPKMLPCLWARWARRRARVRILFVSSCRARALSVSFFLLANCFCFSKKSSVASKMAWHICLFGSQS